MRLAVAVVMVLAGGSAAWAASQSDIVWPTYAQVEYPRDPTLNCVQLQAESAHVAADISLMNRMKTRVEEVLHSAFDMERYGGSNGPGGQRLAGGSVSGKESYAAAREQIVASLKVADARAGHLKTLEPACKPAPQQSAQAPK